MYSVLCEVVVGSHMYLLINTIAKNVFVSLELVSGIAGLATIISALLLIPKGCRERNKLREERFREVVKDLHNEQPSIISKATEFYSELYNSDNSISTRAMIAKKNWLYNNGRLRLVKDVELSVDTGKQGSYKDDIKEISSDTQNIGKKFSARHGLLPQSRKTLVDNARRYGEVKLHNGRTCALAGLYCDERGILGLKVYIGGYFDFYNTCMGFGYETADLLGSNKNKSKFRLRRKYDIFDLDNRYCTIGIVTLTLLHTSVNGGKDVYMLLHQRGKNVSESQNLKNGIPAGSYQPTTVDIGVEADDLVCNIVREFEEELFSKSEYDETYTGDKIRRDRFFNEIRENTYLLGGGFNPQNCFFEVLTLSVLDLDSDSFKGVFEFDLNNVDECILSGVKANDEGDVKVRPFSKEELNDIVYTDGAAPALREIAFIIRDNYESILEQVL